MRSKTKQFQSKPRFAGYSFTRSTVDDLPPVMRIGYATVTSPVTSFNCALFYFLYLFRDADEHKEFLFSETEMSNLGQLLSSSKTEEEEAQREVEGQNELFCFSFKSVIISVLSFGYVLERAVPSETSDCNRCGLNWRIRTVYRNCSILFY